MTTKPSCPINLFDVQSSQKVIGQDKFLKAFEKILNHGGYCQGPETKELDAKLAEYAGVNYCVTCSSGTDALILPLMAWDVKKGDAVLVRDYGGFWEIRAFVRMRDEAGGWYTATSDGVDDCSFRECISYNERTMHLLGTAEDYKEE